MSLSLMSQSVVITGGGGSLSQAIARYLAEEEPTWNVVCPTRQQMDATCEESITSFLKDHPCDLLIAAAGEIADGLLAKVSSDEWDRLLHSNLRGAAFAAKMAGKLMLKKRNGHVIFIGSYSGFHPPVGQVAYATAKAALTGLTKSLAKEWGNANIRVNLILPDFLENRMTSRVAATRKAQVLEQHCLRRYNTESSVAAFIHALHKQLLHTSGQVFNLDSRILAD
jgi:3-oxoacyl-[acyl-carrier protein] reductase